VETRTEDSYTHRGSIDSQLAYLSVQLMEVWALVHKIVEYSRVTGELNHPLMYKVYEDVCERYGEKPRVVHIDTGR